MAKIGLDNFLYGILTEQVGGPVYGTAKKPGKAITCNVAITNNSAMLYADNGLAESDTSFQSGTVTIGLDKDDVATQAELLGHDIDANGEIVRNSNDVAPYVGFGRVVAMIVGGVRKWKVEFLHKVKFGEPSQDDTTKGESIEFGTVEIEGVVATLEDGSWSKARIFDTYDAAKSYLEGIFSNTPITFTVTYNKGTGGGTAPAAATVNDGATVTLPGIGSMTAPTNKEFAGWAKTPNATEAQYAGGATFKPIDDTTLYAVWVATT